MSRCFPIPAISRDTQRPEVSSGPIKEGRGITGETCGSRIGNIYNGYVQLTLICDNSDCYIAPGPCRHIWITWYGVSVIRVCRHCLKCAQDYEVRICLDLHLEDCVGRHAVRHTRDGDPLISQVSGNRLPDSKFPTEAFRNTQGAYQRIWGTIDKELILLALRIHLVSFYKVPCFKRLKHLRTLPGAR